jgi:hypothetical protein
MIASKKTLQTLAVVMSGFILFCSCASTTLIQSMPAEASLYIDDQPVGNTPYSYSDTKIVGSATSIRLEKEGYEPLYTTIYRNEEVDVGAVVGGILFLFPFLWIMGYKSTHTYELMPLVEQSEEEFYSPASDQPVSDKAMRLRELKSLLDEGILTQEEFESEKAKILEEK